MLTLSCTKCGRPVARFEPFAIDKPAASILKRTLGGALGLDLGEIGELLTMLTNPEAGAVSKMFNVQCVDHEC